SCPAWGVLARAAISFGSNEGRRQRPHGGPYRPLDKYRRHIARQAPPRPVHSPSAAWRWADALKILIHCWTPAAPAPACCLCAASALSPASAATRQPLALDRLLSWTNPILPSAGNRPRKLI